MKVEQYKHVNQFHLYQYDKYYGEDGTHILQSYYSTVVKIVLKNEIYNIILGKEWNYSNTTSKYVYMFLEEYGNINFDGVSNKKAYINKLIEDGVIKYDEDMK